MRLPTTTSPQRAASLREPAPPEQTTVSDVGQQVEQVLRLDGTLHFAVAAERDGHPQVIEGAELELAHAPAARSVAKRGQPLDERFELLALRDDDEDRIRHASGLGTTSA